MHLRTWSSRFMLLNKNSSLNPAWYVGVAKEWISKKEHMDKNDSKFTENVQEMNTHLETQNLQDIPIDPVVTLNGENSFTSVWIVILYISIVIAYYLYQLVLHPKLKTSGKQTILNLPRSLPDPYIPITSTLQAVGNRLHRIPKLQFSFLHS